MSEYMNVVSSETIEKIKNGNFKSSDEVKQEMFDWDQGAWDWAMTDEALWEFSEVPYEDLLDIVNSFDSLLNKISSYPTVLNGETKISSGVELLHTVVRHMHLTFVVDRARKVLILV